MYPPSHPAQLAAVRAGAAIGVVQRAVGLADERLVPVLPNLLVAQMETRIVVHEDLRDLPKVRAPLRPSRRRVHPPLPLALATGPRINRSSCHAAAGAMLASRSSGSFSSFS
jgi:hypothetical protein